MKALHTLDAYATWQGGFDYYFVHEDDDSEWESVVMLLKELNLSDAADTFEAARDLFVNHCDAPLDEDEAPYLNSMREFDKRWRHHVPAIHKALSGWRAERGLEEFGASGW